MRLNKLFDTEPPHLKELTPSIFFIPILKIKEMLWEDFDNWSDQNFKYSITLRGNDIIVSGCLELHLELDGKTYKFSGSATMIPSTINNWIPILNSECIKNAVKKIGRKYGMYLNQDSDDELMNLPIEPIQKEAKPKKDKVKQGISQIIKSTSNEQN